MPRITPRFSIPRFSVPCVAAIAAIAACPHGARASEGGASLYLLGSGGPETAILPPLKGVYLDNEIYVYDGSSSANRRFITGGNIVAGLDATIVADFASTLWVPTTNFLGGTLAVGAIVPVGAPMVNVDAVIEGPLGNQFNISRRDSSLLLGDPVATAMVGWTTGKLHLQFATLLNVPVGHYREGRLANLAFHRWAGDASFAASWNDPKAGWDISGKAGFTFNGTNKVTDYKTGTEFHLEASAEKTFSPKFSAGIQGYWFKQVTGDGGEGARLGSYKGEVFGVGGTVATHLVMGRSPATVRLRVLREFDATNRLEGTSVMLGLSLPLHMEMPAAPPAE
ncbi:SphA family protein [Edaphosphingomonas haloaromaticamans]|uniref:MetA-pathway of phenol degradation n=1 Tax=Edaphosphingomonas haloaromaticamans TaxID=653954 RepID=A0A1S1H9A2_9SPHN|nr:transporter [Sphingomonas haloaromaticamans]OHT18655.1 hypothetical protein BHE75_00629 [Sphingomonas haloaromaticamans]